MTYDRLIQFLRGQPFDDGYTSGLGEPVALGLPVRGEKEDISDGERYRGGEVSASITTRFRVRWSPFTAQLTPKDLLECEGRRYEIAGIKERGPRRSVLEITAAASVDE